MIRFVYSIALFLSASLLFVIQPMVAKVLLPIFGGTPAVWTVCLLFFQGLLLAAYGYVWVLSRLPGSNHWRMMHVVVCMLSLVSLPLAFAPISHHTAPELDILLNLFLQLGLPLFVIAASAPLLQFAYSQTSLVKASDPYFLYAASNAGSLLALLSYPWAIERFVNVNQQFSGWTCLFLLYLMILIALFCTSRYRILLLPATREYHPSIDWREKVTWAVLSFIPCSLMLGVTTYITTDLPATPLFWIIPLALYLLSYIVTFARKPLISHAWIKRYFVIALIFQFLVFLSRHQPLNAVLLISVNLIGFFVLALMCHGELVKKRPNTSSLTAYYFWIALGGVVAGIFNGLLAPHLFSQTYEYPLIIFLSLALFWPIRTIYFYSSIVLVYLGLLFSSSNSTQTLSQQRNFYGIKRVFSQEGAHVLMSQNTLHGFQVQDDENPTDGSRAYYGAIYPIVQKLQDEVPSLRAVVLGLGIGTLACQFRQQDQLTIIEIDQQMIDIANDPKLFTYLRDCPVHPYLVKSDGRLAMNLVPNGIFNLLIMDAFNSDAIPIHLLTQEAFTLYQRKLRPDGIILVNITNRHLRLLPVITAAGRQLDMIVLSKVQMQNNQAGQFAAEWALLTTNAELAMQLMGKEGWHFVANAQGIHWTDHYSNLIALLK